MAALRRQQLSDLAVAYGLDVNPDATKEDLLMVVEAAEAQGIFNGEPKDKYRLTKASKTPDEWQDYRNSGMPMPPFEDPTAPDANSFAGLQQRMKAAGLDSFGKSKKEMQEALASAGH